jgi:hypothetical protein
MTWRIMLWSAGLGAALLGLAYVLLLLGEDLRWARDRIGLLSGSLATLGILALQIGVLTPVLAAAILPAVRRFYREDELPVAALRFLSPLK